MSNCPFCDSDYVIETFEMTNITDREGNITPIEHEFTRCGACKQEFVPAHQARNNDFKLNQARNSSVSSEVEHATLNGRVGGSNPPRSAK